jgi:hypothetical protein
MAKDLERMPLDSADGLQLSAPTPSSWSHSSVSIFHVRYSPPADDLDIRQSVEALVEGSQMSLLRENTQLTKELAWINREGRNRRYEGHRVGGTVVVHFIKQNMWFLETAVALLEGDDETEAERYHGRRPSSSSLKPFGHRSR